MQHKKKRKRKPFPVGQTDVIPYLFGPFTAFMLACAVKKFEFFAGAVAITLFLNIPTVFQGDPYWKKKPRVVVASLGLLTCLWVLFFVNDLRTQDETLLFIHLAYGFLVVCVETYCINFVKSGTDED